MEKKPGQERKEKVTITLFGVTICGDHKMETEETEEEVMRKSSSMPNLASADDDMAVAAEKGDHGYLSDDSADRSSPSARKTRRRTVQERKKGVPWTEEEHKTFLAGLKELGKGDWRGISRKFVTTRTPTQVASHAQKYFLRQSNPGTKKRRSSLFDFVIKDEAPSTEAVSPLPLTNNKRTSKQEINHVGRDSTMVSSKDLQSPPVVPLQTRNVEGDVSVNMEKRAITNISLSLPVTESESNNLDLSIAPPRSNDLANYSSLVATGAIKVL